MSGKTTNSLLEQLREQIEIRHSEALEALENLAKYTAGDTMPAEIRPRRSGSFDSPVRRRHRRRKPETSIRSQVLEAISSDWVSVESIEEETMLDKRQIRGVLYAPALKNSIQVRQMNGQQEYYREADEDDDE